MAEQSAALIHTVRVIDRFTDTTGMWLAWLNIPLVAAVAYEGIARYGVHAPTLGSVDITPMLYRALRLQRADPVVVRHHLHALRHDLHARRRLCTPQRSAYPH